MGSKHSVVTIAGRFRVSAPYTDPRTGNWIFRYQDAQTGKWSTKSSLEKSKAKGRERVVSWLEQVAEADLGLGGSRSIRFDEAYQTWLDTKEIAPESLVDLEGCFRTLTRTCVRKEDPVAEIDPIDLQRYFVIRKNEGLSPRTRKKELGHLRSFFAWAVNMGLCEANPVQAISVRQQGGRVFVGRALTPDQARALLRACYPYGLRTVSGFPHDALPRLGDTLYRAVLIGLFQGLRSRNVSRATVGHVSLIQGQEEISFSAPEMKGRRPHWMPLHPEVVREIHRMIITTKRATARTPLLGKECYCFRKSLLRACDRAKIPRIRFHDLRHTFSTWLGKVATAAVRRELMGHAPANVSELYDHASREELREAMLRLPSLTAGDPYPLSIVSEEGEALGGAAAAEGS